MRGINKGGSMKTVTISKHVDRIGWLESDGQGVDIKFDRSIFHKLREVDSWHTLEKFKITQKQINEFIAEVEELQQD